MLLKLTIKIHKYKPSNINLFNNINEPMYINNKINMYNQIWQIIDAK